MHRAIVDASGRLDLGDQAIALGFAPGQTVEIIVTRSGSLIVALADDHDAIDVPFRKPLPARREQLAIGGRRRTG